jgi:polar amino acid transport system substrate-binding protein
MNAFRRAVTVAGVLAVLAAGGCGGSAAESTANAGLDLTGAVTVDESLRAKLPQTARDRGFVRLVTDASYAPMEYFAADGRTIIGFEPDLAAALGAVLGIRVEMVFGDFATALDELAKGTYDGVFSSMTDTADREKKADFVNYFSTGSSILVQRGNPQRITTMAGLCGRRVAVEAGTVQEDMLRRDQAKCGGKPMILDVGRTGADALLRLRTGRAVASLLDYPPAVALVTDSVTDAYYELASAQQYEPGLYGIAVARDSTGLRDALQAALNRLISTGTYGELLQRWKLTTGGLSGATVNAGD